MGAKLQHEENEKNQNTCGMFGLQPHFCAALMQSTKTDQSWKREDWLPKNTVFQLFLSTFFNVSGPRDGFELPTALGGQVG